MKTTVMLTREEALGARRWFLVDANGVALGRLATRVASILRGKNKPGFTPHVDCGDFVLVVNASKIRLTGKKLENKVYVRHTEYPGGLRQRTAGEVMKRSPEVLVREAVVGMLPKGRLGRQLARKLNIYPEANHPHSAQQPTVAPHGGNGGIE